MMILIRVDVHFLKGQMHCRCSNNTSLYLQLSIDVRGKRVFLLNNRLVLSLIRIMSSKEKKNSVSDLSEEQSLFMHVFLMIIQRRRRKRPEIEKQGVHDVNQQ